MIKDNKAFTYLKIFIVIIGIFSVIPIIYLAGFDFATGDDLGYSANVRQTWLLTHSFLQCIISAVNYAKNVYYTWQGTWFTVFLFEFNPELLGFGFYAIVPIFMVAMQFIAVWGLVRHFIKNKFSISSLDYVSVSMMVMIIVLQFIPYPTCGMFWWTGSVHYVVPFVLLSGAIIFGDNYIMSYRLKSLIGLIICMTFLGGSSYQAAILAPTIIFIVFLWRLVVLKNRFRFKIVLIILPIVFEGIGLKISAMAPGNIVRGGENFGFTIGKAFSTIKDSFVTATYYIKDYGTERTAMFAIFIMIGVVVWFGMKATLSFHNADMFKAPALFVVLSYCVFSASFAPQIFASVDVSGGVYNTYLYTFTMCLIADIVYVEGYIITHVGYIKKGDIKYSSLISIVFICGILVLVGRHSVKQTTDYVSYLYVKSGQAADYKAQMKLQYELLSTEEKNIILPMINDEQGPLQCMPVTDDNDNFTNYVNRNYYDKDSVIAIPREEWIEKYGSSN